MKQVALFSVLMFAIGNVGAAIAQDRVVSPTTTSESAKTITDAVSGAAKDAAKDAEKAGDMKESSGMKMKPKDAEDATKMKMKDKMK